MGRNSKNSSVFGVHSFPSYKFGKYTHCRLRPSGDNVCQVSGTKCRFKFCAKPPFEYKRTQGKPKIKNSEKTTRRRVPGWKPPPVICCLYGSDYITRAMTAF